MSAAPRRVRLRAGGVQVLARTLRPVLDVAGVASGVTEVLDAVRERGDDALVEGVRRFDCPDFTHDRLRVPPADPRARRRRAGRPACGWRSAWPPPRCARSPRRCCPGTTP